MHATHTHMYRCITYADMFTHAPDHPPPHTEQGSNTHVQAPMPANESFFTNVMPLLLSHRVPLWVGQEPERSSGAPLVSPEMVHPSYVLLQGAASAEPKQRAKSSSNLLMCFRSNLRAPPIPLACPLLLAAPRSAVAPPCSVNQISFHSVHQMPFHRQFALFIGAISNCP